MPGDAWRVIADRPNAHSVTLTVDGAQPPGRITLTCPSIDVGGEGDVALCATLLPAMASTAALTIADPVSPRLLRGTAELQRIFRSWFPHLEMVTVGAAPVTRPVHSDRATAAFFSGGVDSFFTALERADEIDALVFVYGFDVATDNAPARSRITPELRKAAAALGKPLVEVETDIRNFTNRYLGWGTAHAAAMAAVAHLLSPAFSRFLFAASVSYAQLVPWGSHPLTDPLWSSDAVDIVHDGASHSRLDKTERVAQSDVALSYLRVCWRDPSAYNCGRCRKCLITMASLRLFGALGRCETFPRKLNLAELAMVPIEKAHRPYWQAIAGRTDEVGGDPALARAVRAALLLERPKRVVRRVVRRGVRRLVRGHR